MAIKVHRYTLSTPLQGPPLALFLPNLFLFARKLKAKPTDKDPNATVLNEHGYFGSPIRHYCRLCEALNYNSRWRFTRFELVPHLNLREEKTYNDLAFSWSKASSCRGGFWRRGKQQLRYNVYQCINLSLEEILWSRWFEQKDVVIVISGYLLGKYIFTVPNRIITTYWNFP